MNEEQRKSFEAAVTNSAVAAIQFALKDVEANLASLLAEIEALREERDALREALKELVNWTPSADTYRRLGFNPEAPMRALKNAWAALAKGVLND